MRSSPPHAMHFSLQFREFREFLGTVLEGRNKVV
jgi:hypothetical protein